MSTTTITPGALAAAAGPADEGKVALIKAFWLKIKSAVGSILAPVGGFLGGVLRAIPAPLAAIAAPVAMCTRWGYNAVGRIFGWGAKLIGKVIGFGASIVHRGIDLAGDLIGKGIGIFSQPAADKFGDGMARFGTWRLNAAGFVRTFAVSVFTVVSEAYYSPWTRRVVMGVAIFVVGVTVFGLVAPAAFASTMAALPVEVGLFTSGIAFSGTAGTQLVYQTLMTMIQVNLVIRIVKDLYAATQETPYEPSVAMPAKKQNPKAEKAADTVVAAANGVVDGVIEPDRVMTVEELEVERKRLESLSVVGKSPNKPRNRRRN